MIINSSKDICAHIKTMPAFIETKIAYEEGAPGSFDEVEEVLLEVIVDFEGRPEYGTDWDAWLQNNIDEMLQEAVSIVM